MRIREQNKMRFLHFLKTKSTEEKLASFLVSNIKLAQIIAINGKKFIFFAHFLHCLFQFK